MTAKQLLNSFDDLCRLHGLGLDYVNTVAIALPRRPALGRLMHHESYYDGFPVAQQRHQLVK